MDYNTRKGEVKMERKIDLHIHSTRSDGELTIKEIERIAEEKNLRAYAVTDHDSITPDFVPRENGVLYIPGIELSVVDPFLPRESRFHVVGLDIDMHAFKLQDHLIRIHKNSLDSVARKIEYIRSHYQNDLSKIPEDEFDTLLRSTKNVGAPDIAMILLKYGIVQSIDEAFIKYLREAGVKTRFEKKSILPEEAISMIHDASGFAVLAHPCSLQIQTYKKLREYVAYLKTIGLDALEVQHIHNEPNLRKFLLELCDEFHLLESGGSDYHGPIKKPGIEIAEGYHGNIHITNVSILNEIEKRKVLNQKKAI